MSSRKYAKSIIILFEARFTGRKEQYLVFLLTIKLTIDQTVSLYIFELLSEVILINGFMLLLLSFQIK